MYFRRAFTRLGLFAGCDAENKNAVAVVSSAQITPATPVDPAAAPAVALVKRTLPTHADQFTFAIIPAENGVDVFEIESDGDKICLRGNSPLSLASAFNYYLQNVAFREVCNYGNNLDIPAGATLPPGDGKNSPQRERALPHGI